MNIQFEPNYESNQAPLVAQLVKNLPMIQETQVLSLGQEDPLEKEMATQSSGLENPMERDAWKATVYGVRHDLSN